MGIRTNFEVKMQLNILNDEQQAIFDAVVEDIKINKDEGCFGDNIIIITGQAGTGKSFLSAAIVNYLEENPISKFPVKCIALTHKAANEFSKKLSSGLSGSKASTIHSYLNIRAVIDFKTGKEKFEVQQGAKIQRSSVLFIDEVSMIDEDLFNIIRKHSEFYETVIMIGDEYQVPAVNSSNFNLFNYPGVRVHKLEKVVRQAENNPIIQMVSEIVQKIKDKDFDLNFCRNLITAYSSRHYEIKHLDIENFIKDYRSYVETSIGQPLVNSKFTSALITTFTNERVDKYNQLAKKIFKQNNNPDYIDIGDILVLQEPAFSPYTGDVELPANTEFLVDNLVMENHKGIQCYALRSKTFPNFYLRVIDETDTHQLSLYNTKLDNFKKQAICADSKNKGVYWKQYYDFKHTFCCVKQIYACTTHKAQGSTVERIYVDLNNMPWGRDIELAYRLTYVACTRSTDEVICTF